MRRFIAALIMAAALVVGVSGLADAQVKKFTRTVEASSFFPGFVSGVVKSTKAACVAEVKINLYRIEPDETQVFARQVKSNPNGTYSFTDVDAGFYIVRTPKFTFGNQKKCLDASSGKLEVL